VAKDYFLRQACLDAATGSEGDVFRHGVSE
jgi:hypothetical protein